jgi:glycosyltransferase involved in cell wall biosynthesis
MKIFFDCSTLVGFQGNLTGIPRTVSGLMDGFENLEHHVEFVAFNERSSTFYRIKTGLFPLELDSLAHFNKGDILITASATWSYPSFNQAIRDLKNKGLIFYQIFYDLIPSLYPHFYRDGIFGNYYLEWNREAFSLCDGAFAISDNTKKDMNELLVDNQNASPITVIRLGEDIYTPVTRQTNIENFIDGQDFILAVGTLEIRKNFTVLLDAYRHLARLECIELPLLVIVGRNGWNNGGIKYQCDIDPVLRKHTRVLENVNDQDLLWLYQNCQFSLYPSLYEGWGLPVSECLRNGRPCICSRNSSMVEIAPDLCVFASPYSVVDWTAAILYFLQNPKKLRELSQIIRNSYEPTTWTQTASSIISSILEKYNPIV